MTKHLDTQPALGHYRADIDGLRALAVLLVLGFHAFPLAVPGGFIGVDIFFVISGFLISGILFRGYDSNRFSLREFYARRIRRIFPALIIVITACFAYGYISLPPHEFTQIAKHIAGSSVFLSNFILWNEAGYFDSSAAIKPLLHLWSLGIEEQFYILWPPLLYLAHKKKYDLLKVTFWIAAASFALNIFVAQRNAIADFYSPLTRFWELAAGGMLAYSQYAPRHKLITAWQKRLSVVTASHGWCGKQVRNNASVALGIALIFVAAFAFNKEAAYPGWRALLPVAGSLLLLAADEKAFLTRKIMAHPMAVAIGLISYPLYLWHWPLLSFLHIHAGGEPSALTRSAVLVISFILAAATYYGIEKYVRFGPHKKMNVIALCNAMVLVGVLSLTFYCNGASAKQPGYYLDQLNWKYWNNGSCQNTYRISPCQQSGDFPRVMIIGDSHGNHLYPGFALTSPQFDVISIGSCLPLIGINLHVFKNQAGNPCEHGDTFPIIAQAINDNPGLQTVLISARWRHVLTGHMQYPAERDLWGGVNLVSRVPGEEKSGDAELVDHGLARMVTYLQSQRLRVALIRATPEMDIEMKEYCKLMTRDPPANCSFPKTDYLEYRKLEDHMIETLKQKFPDILVYDPMDALCDQDKCYLMKDGVLRYRDNHHLSVNGSIYLAKDIKRWMSENGLGP